MLSRSGDDRDIPVETLERFKAAIRDHGYDPEDSCIFKNAECTNRKLQILFVFTMPTLQIILVEIKVISDADYDYYSLLL